MRLIVLLAVLAPSLARAADPLAFSRTVLPNGLELIVHEDHTVPVAAVDVWYHVGSKDERPGKTGFAHLFEHLMFKGSAHIGDGQHFRYITEAGGMCNGTTNRDRTNYFEVVPSNFLERALWLEADRMGFLLETVSQEKLDNQREVVRNERRQNYENRPYGLALKVIAETIFPPSHPYHWLTIGDHADLEAASLDDVRAFYRKYYSPSNATLVVAGDVDPQKVEALVTRYFGELPSAPAVARRTPPPVPRLDAEVRVQRTDRVSLERLYVVWPSVALFQPGDAELDLLALVLGGKSGRLYKRLVYDMRVAQSVEVEQSSGLYASTFEITVTMKAGHSAAEALPVIDEEVARARKEVVSARELEKAQNRFEAGLYYHLMPAGGFGGRADQLAYYAVYAGDPGYFARDLARYHDAKADEVRAVAERTLGPGRLVLTVSPKSTSRAEQGSPKGGR
jgi:zinc protease